MNTNWANTVNNTNNNNNNNNNDCGQFSDAQIPQNGFMNFQLNPGISNFSESGSYTSSPLWIEPDQLIAQRMVEKFLDCRNMTTEDYEKYSQAGMREAMIPFSQSKKSTVLTNTDILAQHLFDHMQEQDQIVIITDFDTDGIMSGIIALTGLNQLGLKAALMVPDPTQGYGISSSMIDDLLKQYPAAKAIITCDVGQTSYEAIKYAKSQGLNVYVTDHHPEDQPCPADVVVNPQQKAEKNPTEICGAMVIQKVLEYYALNYTTLACAAPIEWLRVFAGIATIGDMMPLNAENRGTVQFASQVCSRICSSNVNPTYLNCIIKGTGTLFQSCFQGLAALLEALLDQDKISVSEAGLPVINEETFGFLVSPLCNAIKRIEAPMTDIFDLFFRYGSKESMACKILSYNEQKKQLLNEMEQYLVTSVQPFSPMIGIVDGPGGMMGLLAARMMDKTKLPSVVVRPLPNGEGYRGSGRSMNGINIRDALKQAGINAEGHKEAFGVTFKNDFELAEGKRIIKECIEQAGFVSSPEANRVSDKLPDFSIGVSSTFPFSENAAKSFLDSMDAMRPFGKGFEKPCIRFNFRYDAAEWKAFGSQNKHLKITLNNGTEILCWNQGHLCDDGKALCTKNIEYNKIMGGVFSVIGSYEYDYNGSIQINGIFVS